MRRGDGGVDGGETQRSSSCHGVRKTPRGCEGLSVDDERSQRVAPVDSGTDRSTVNIGEHGEVILHQCGFLGVRVGEASHPGPRRSHQDNTSDDEPLVRSNGGRHVVPRRQVRDRAVSGSQECCMETLLDGLEADLTVVDSESSVTVPATPGASAGVDQTHGDANGNLRDEVSNVSAVRSDAERQ